MRIFIAILIKLIFILNAKAQEIKLKPNFEKTSSYVLTQNCRPIGENVIDSICKEFNVFKKSSKEGVKFYRFKVGYSLYQFHLWDVKIKFDSTIKVNQNNINNTFNKGDSLCLRGFFVNSQEGKKMSKRYSIFLLSSFLQETNTEYSQNKENFLSLSLKSNAEFWKRNMINMGYGTSYAFKDNPFTSGGGFAVVFGYFWETLHYIPIFGGPFFGKTHNDKISIPIVGLSSLIIWKTIFYGLIMGQPIIKTYNRFATMKYKVPKSIKD